MNDDSDDVIDPATVMQALDHISQTVTIMNKIVAQLRSHVEKTAACGEAEFVCEHGPAAEKVLH